MYKLANVGLKLFKLTKGDNMATLTQPNLPFDLYLLNYLHGDKVYLKEE